MAAHSTAAATITSKATALSTHLSSYTLTAAIAARAASDDFHF